MADGPEKHGLVRRMLLALDATTGAASLEAAIEMAARLRADVVALFIEDEEMLRAADYPHSRHISFPSGEYERVSGNTLARQLRTIAERVEQRLQRATSRLGVRVSFQIVRGAVQDEVAARAEETDLIWVDRSSHTFTHHALVGGPGGGLIERVRQPILVWRSPSGQHGPVLVILGSDDEPERLLRAASRIGGDTDRELIVLLDVESSSVRAALRKETRVWLDDAGHDSTFYRLDRGSPDDLEKAVRKLGAELVFVSANRSRRPGLLFAWLEITERPVFLVR